jgi:hypothetical protein
MQRQKGNVSVASAALLKAAVYCLILNKTIDGATRA